MENIKVIMQDVEVQIEEKKSKFIANIFYVKSVEEAEQMLQLIKKKYFDARHHCYAYRIVENEHVKEKQSDDGEPSGTAGAPILNILQKNALLNVFVVVTRYFGGTLLGTGGLVRAYSDATIKAIDEAGKGIQKQGYLVKIMIAYKDLEKFKYYCRKNKISILNLIYEEEICCTIEITREEKIKLLEKNQKEIPILENTVLEEKYIKTNIE